MTHPSTRVRGGCRAHKGTSLTRAGMEGSCARTLVVHSFQYISLALSSLKSATYKAKLKKIRNTHAVRPGRFPSLPDGGPGPTHTPGQRHPYTLAGGYPGTEPTHPHPWGICRTSNTATCVLYTRLERIRTELRPGPPCCSVFLKSVRRMKVFPDAKVRFWLCAVARLT